MVLSDPANHRAPQQPTAPAPDPETILLYPTGPLVEDAATASRRAVLLGGVGLVGGYAVRDPDSGLGRAGSRPGSRDAGRGRLLVSRPARSMAQMLGVCLVTHRTEGAWGQHEKIQGALEELGATWVRSRFRGTPAQQRWLAELGAQGVRVCGNMGAPFAGRGPEPVVEALAKGPAAAAFWAVEGPNEWNLRGGANWARELRAFQERLAAAVRRHETTRDLLVVAPALGMRKGFRELGRVSCDLGNIHLYTGGKTPGDRVDDYLTQLKAVSGDRRVIVTETGWHYARNWPGTHYYTPQDVAGVDAVRLLLEYFSRGVEQVAIYELLDDRPDPGLAHRELNFGLLDETFTRRPAFTSLSNVTSILNRVGYRGAQPARSRTVEVLDAPADLKMILLAGEDERMVLCLWRTVDIYDPIHRRRLDAPARPVTLRWPGPCTVRRYEPVRSATALDTEHSSVTSVRVGAGPHFLDVTGWQ